MQSKEPLFPLFRGMLRIEFQINAHSTTFKEAVRHFSVANCNLASMLENRQILSISVYNAKLYVSKIAQIGIFLTAFGFYKIQCWQHWHCSKSFCYVASSSYSSLAQQEQSILSCSTLLQFLSNNMHPLFSSSLQKIELAQFFSTRPKIVMTDAMAVLGYSLLWLDFCWVHTREAQKTGLEWILCFIFKKDIC